MTAQGTRKIVMHQGAVENIILQGDQVILAYLSSAYVNDTGLRVSNSWATSPFAQMENSDTDAKLIGVRVNNSTTVDPYTAAWVVTFSAATTFNVISSLEGTMITGGTTVADTTSSNGDVTFGSNGWVGNFTTNDKFFFSVVDAHPLVWGLSNMMATASVVSTLFGEEFPNLSSQAESLNKRASKILQDLSNPMKSGVKLSTYSGPSDSSTWVDYYINELGEDRSSYLLPTPYRSDEII